MIDKESVFAYLDAVKESGQINMFGASIHVEKEFKIKRDEARKLTVEWMKTFGKRHPDRSTQQ